MFVFLPCIACIVIVSASNNCIGSKFIDFADGNVPDTDPAIPYQFQLIESPNYDQIIDHGSTFKVTCPPNMEFAYPWSSKSLICDDGEVKQDDVSKYNHCIKYDQCSAAFFPRDWVVEGYRLNSKIERLMDDGPLITDSIPFSESVAVTLRKYGKQLPINIKAKYSDKASVAHNTYPPLLLLTCDILYTSFSAINVNKDTYKPQAYCTKKPEWKRAKWSKGSSLKQWNSLHTTCRKIIKLSMKKSPPPQGCTVLSQSRAQCIAYKKYCAWDELQKHKTKFDMQKVDVRVCSMQCAPWSCYSGLKMPVECNGAASQSYCTKIIPAYAYWCEWDREEQLCVSKKIKEESKDFPVQVDLCTTDNLFCRASKSEKYWRKQAALFSGNVEKLTEIKFGYEYQIFGIRHVVEPLSSLSEMRGSVVTAIRATHEMNDMTDPTEETLDAAVIIEPNQIKRTFGLMTRTKYKLLNSMFDLSKAKKSSKSKPMPEYDYVSIELKSDGMEVPSPPISFYLSTYTSTDCKRCKLVKYKPFALGSRINTLTNVLYVVDTAEASRAITSLELPTMEKADVKLKMKLTMEPGPERCGKHDIGCAIILEPIMNDAASSLFEFKCILPVRARLSGYDDSVITIFGVKPSKRKKVTTKYQIKVAKTADFLDFEGQTATIRWSVDMGLVKSVMVRPSELAEYEMVVQQPIKIEFKSFDNKLKTRPDKTKWVTLIAKKTMPVDCSIQSYCNLCGIQVKPSNIRIRKGFKRLRLKIKPTIPGEFQVHFSVTGQCADLVANPPSLLVQVFQPNAGFINVPETLGPILNGEWSDEFDISITRPPFRTEIKIKPLSMEFATDPLELRFDNVKSTLIQQSSTSLSKLGITNSKEIKIMPSLECGGGPPRELRWALSGAIDEFYAPHSTYVEVQAATDDDDYCKYKQYEALLNSSNGANMSFGFVDEQQLNPNIPQPLPKWRFEYYLIGGAITICILVVINQFKEQRFDRMIAVMSGTLQAQHN
eukprot:198149_1